MCLKVGVWKASLKVGCFTTNLEWSIHEMLGKQVWKLRQPYLVTLADLQDLSISPG